MKNEQAQPLTIFIGFDERQPEAFKVCQESILQHASIPVEIIPLNHKELRSQGYFNRPWKIDESGHYYDIRDERPFSTQFSHSRFLVPLLSKNKSKYTIFVDSDFVFLSDVAKLISHCASGVEKYPVYVVKHNYTPGVPRKMDNCIQASYQKKLWTSLMVFDNSSVDLQRLTEFHVNNKDGRWLHMFEWLGQSPDELIGSIPEGWNFIPNHSEGCGDVHAIHFTEGTPHMKGYENCKFSELYWDAYAAVVCKEAKALIEKTEKNLNAKKVS